MLTCSKQHRWNLRTHKLMVPLFNSYSFFQHLSVLGILIFASLISNVSIRPAKLYVLTPFIRILTDAIGMRIAYAANRMIRETNVSSQRIRVIICVPVCHIVYSRNKNVTSKAAERSFLCFHFRNLLN